MTPTLCIDAGHGGHDPGAVGPAALEEKRVALNVAMLLRDMLDTECHVILTRTDDRFVALTERAEFANRNGADAFLSIHCNAGPPGLGAGYEVWTSKGQTASDWFATDLFAAFKAAFPAEPGRMDMSDGDPDKESQFTVLAKTRMAAALFELEFIHTSRGEGILRNADNQRMMAAALAAGVRKYFKLGTKAVEPPKAVPVKDVAGTPTPLAVEALAVIDRAELRTVSAFAAARTEIEALFRKS